MEQSISKKNKTTKALKFITKTPHYFIIGSKTIITFFPHYTIQGFKFIFSKKNQDNENLKNLEKKIIPLTILTLSITTYLISIFILTRWFVQNKRTQTFTNNFENETIYNDIETNETGEYQDEITNTTTADTVPKPEETTPETPSNKPSKPTINTDFININLNSYIQKNPDTVGWLKVNGTKINYPLVKHTDNDYYLTHDFNNRKTNNGWVFADYRNNFENFDNNTIIYGHNLINNTMFGSLPKYLNKNYLSNKNNHYIKLSTKSTNTVWQIFSVYKIEPTTDYLQARFNSTDNYQEFLNLIKNRSYYNFNLDLTYTDKIITLSTCSDSGTKRVVIHAKLIKIESK